MANYYNKNEIDISPMNLNELNANPMDDTTLQIVTDALFEGSNDSFITNPISKKSRPVPIEANVIISNANPSVATTSQRLTVSNTTPSLENEGKNRKCIKIPHGRKKIHMSRGKRFSLLKSLQFTKKRENPIVQSIKNKYRKIKSYINLKNRGSRSPSPERSRSPSPQERRLKRKKRPTLAEILPRSPRGSRSPSPQIRRAIGSKKSKKRPTLAQLLPENASNIRFVDKDDNVLAQIPNRTCRHLLSHINKKHSTNRDNKIYKSILKINPLVPLR